MKGKVFLLLFLVRILLGEGVWKGGKELCCFLYDVFVFLFLLIC